MGGKWRAEYMALRASGSLEWNSSSNSPPPPSRVTQLSNGEGGKFSPVRGARVGVVEGVGGGGGGRLRTGGC